MRIHIMSDIHLEFAPFQRPAVDADLVILAGDIHLGTDGIKWILESFADVPVLYVLGNHEFYTHTIPGLTSTIKDLAKGSNVHVLENDRFELGDIVFLGATLWSDFKLDGNPKFAEALSVTGVTDFKLISVSPSLRKFHPADARRFFDESVVWLERESALARGKKLVIVTHHAPSARSISARFRGHPLNPAFASNLEEFIKKCGAKYWIHGHLHQARDYLVGETRVLANPRGYPHEMDCNFNPLLTIDI